VRGEQRERLVGLAAQAAVENDPQEFHALLLELYKVLSEQLPPFEAMEKPRPNHRPTR
jgi:hypothetical protein